MFTVSRWSATVTAAARRVSSRAPPLAVRAAWLGDSSKHPTASETPAAQADAANNYGGLELELFKFMVEKSSPFISRVFHMEIASISKNELTIAVPFNKALVGNPAAPCLHGGVVATAIDHTAGFCVWAALNDPHQRVSTVDLRVDYLAPAPCDTLYYVATLQHISNKLGRADVVVYDKNREKKIAIGRACFNIYKTPQDLTGALKKHMAYLKSRPGHVNHDQEHLDPAQL